ncbi:hypothetical protein BJY04DRAFT_191557 [Aspergillus karnatakaensis]|uniref:uncharacterized protein n=1 Tax=Aspergillus karnatakaensis TaxID=1810916 RepID=UPI003CCCC543
MHQRLPAMDSPRPYLWLEKCNGVTNGDLWKHRPIRLISDPIGGQTKFTQLLSLRLASLGIGSIITLHLIIYCGLSRVYLVLGGCVMIMKVSR